MTNKDFIKSISLEGEIWKDVIGYEGLYMVSSFGRVISLERQVPNGKSYRTLPFTIKNQISSMIELIINDMNTIYIKVKRKKSNNCT